ncbi:sugar phosphate isomerase/epimerase [Paenibacillaceae bacterium]|nr:sugar phosphate isomerase/epimerase [Paenibacillaceae bacterium]
MKLAAFSGVLIDHDLKDAFGITKQLGFDGIEIAAREPHLSPASSASRVREARLMSNELGLDIPVLAGYMGGFSTADDKACEQAFEAFQRLLDMAGELGSEAVRVQPGGPNAFLAAEAHYARAAHWINKCAAEAAKHRLRIVLEIHNESLIETADSAARLLSMIEHEHVGIIHDAGNMYITGTDYGRASIQKLGRRLFHVHMKDELLIARDGVLGSFTSLTERGEERFLPCRMGEGEVDYRSVMGALSEVGYDGWITLETHAPFPAQERLAHDYHAVIAMLGQDRNEQ